METKNIWKDYPVGLPPQYSLHTTRACRVPHSVEQSPLVIQTFSLLVVLTDHVKLCQLLQIYYPSGMP